MISCTCRNLAAMTPFILWYTAFSLWIITIDSFGISGFARTWDWDVFRHAVKAYVVWLSLAALLPDREQLKRFVRWVVVVMMINAIASFLSPSTPWLATLLLQNQDLKVDAATYFDKARAGGFLGNANQAGHAFLFAALLSLWADAYMDLSRLVNCIFWSFYDCLAPGGVSAGVQLHNLHCSANTGASPDARVRLFKQGVFVAFLVGGLFVGYTIIIQGYSSEGLEKFDRFYQVEMQGELTRGQLAAIAFDKIWETHPFIGNGSFSFRNYLIRYGSDGNSGCHNIYLAIWGEAGIFMLLAYLLVISQGITRALKANLTPSDRVPIFLMWICYMLIGMTYHGQLTDFNQFIFIGLLFALPAVLAQPYQTNLINNQRGVHGRRRLPADVTHSSHYPGVYASGAKANRIFKLTSIFNHSTHPFFLYLN